MLRKDIYRSDDWLQSLIKELPSRFIKIAALFCLIVLPAPYAFSNDVAIITHAKNTDNSLSLKSVRSAFTMKKKFWSSGEEIKVFVLPNENDVHKVFCRKHLKVFPRQLEAVWYRIEYSGTGSRPVEVSSVEEMIDKVSTTEGAIGYIPSQLLDKKVQQVYVR